MLQQSETIMQVFGVNQQLASSRETGELTPSDHRNIAVKQRADATKQWTTVIHFVMTKFQESN